MRRVLLVRLSAMGDVVQSLGAVEALARARPDLELHFVVQRTFAPLLEGLDHIAGVIAHDRRGGPRSWIDTRRRMRALGPDVAIDLQGNWKSASVCLLSGARVRIGAPAGMSREPASRWLLNRVPSTAGGAHRHPAVAALTAVRALAPEVGSLAPRLVPTDAEIDREAEALAALGRPGGPLRVLVGAAPDDPRAWPVAAMAREAAAAGPPAVCVMGPAEAGVQSPEGLPVLRHGPRELRRLVGLGGLLARNGSTVIGPDRGATHVLAACGARTVALFGPQDPAATAPVSAELLVRRDHPPCVPCRQRSCHHPDGPVCMDFTTAEGEAVTR